MVKPPKIRHSKTTRDPVTIELEPGAVSRVEETAKPGDSTPDATDADAGPEAVENAEQATTAESPQAENRPAATEQDWVPFDQPEADSRAETSSGVKEPSEEGATEFGRSGTQERTAAMSSSVPPVEPRRPNRSGFSGLAAGLVGGIIALLGASGLQFAGLLPSPGAGSGDAAAVSSLQAEVAALRQQVEGLPAAGDGADVQGLRQTVDESTSRIDGLNMALDQVKSDVAALKSAVEAGGAGENAGLQALQDKIAEIEKSVAAAAQPGANATPAEITALGEKLAAVETAVNAATSAQSANDSRIGTVEQGLAALEQSVASLTGKVDAQASQPRVALAIAVSALKAAIDAGGSFTSQVETFAAVAPNAPELAALRSLAEKGIPSRDQIAAEAPAAATAMIDAGRTVDDNAGYFERLLASAESLVKVRPVGPVEGAGVPETVARLEAALGSGDFARAIAEYDTLPEAPKAAGHAFMEKVRARLAAEQLVEKATAGALKA
ncbi:COG4223 family protein [Mesorhizobium sp. ZC-5]|uniref:COG4223 family protein n=1 Tax=Mesorhizobium sp. ZC-5 TaxID=2986066 RepID=UPI0021E94B24|nr:phage tail protein [Mesorhizobium sp. ZC-5]MCV3239126.1 phage tail protein [Mesorhizobium sp. ZC-5]